MRVDRFDCCRPHVLSTILTLFCLLLGGVGAAQAATGNITGTVTDAVDSPVSGIQVIALAQHASGNDGQWLSSAVTGANGTYNLGGLDAGTYRLCFYGWNPTAQSCFDDNISHVYVDDVVVVAGQTTADVDVVAADLIPPTVVSTQPADGTAGVPVDQPIVVQFDRSMDTANCRVELEDWLDGPDVERQIIWSQRVQPNDTLTLVLGVPLRHSMSYYLSLGCRDANGTDVNGYGEAVFVSFSTAGASGDVSAPRVTSTAPYAGQVGGIALPISILFDKPIDPATVNIQSVQLTGPGTPTYRLEIRPGFMLKIWPQGLQIHTQYQVTLTTALADAEGHGLAASYSFGFDTGIGDTTAPRVVQTRPADGSAGLEWETISVNFSESMNPDRIVPTTVKVFDETNQDVPIGIHIDKRWVGEDGARSRIEISRAIEEGRRWQPGHTYRVVLDQRTADLAGNPLGRDQVFRFTTVNNVAGSQTPPIMMGEGDSRAYRQPDGRVTLDLEVSAHSSTGGALDVDVVDLTQPGKRWDNLQQDDGNYVYTTPDGGDEGLTPGAHALRITVTETSNGQSRTLLWTIYVFNTVPSLTGPADEATGASLQPSFSFATDGMNGAAAYTLRISDAASDETIFSSPLFPNAGSAYSVRIPSSQALEPGKTYRWFTAAVDSFPSEVGLAFSEARTFTTVDSTPGLCLECLPNWGGWRAIIR